MTNKIDLSLIIPAFNEENRIIKTLKIIIDYLNSQNKSYEIIIIDDGSIDRTYEKVNQLHNKNIKILSYHKNQGKGYAINFGIKKAIGKYVIYLDADNSTPIEEIESLFKYIDDYQVVIGSRYIKGSNIKIKQPFLRRLFARFGNLLIQIMLLPGLADTQCGFKMFQSSAAKQIFSRQTIWRWGFDIEILYIAKKMHYRIKQVPVDWFNDEASHIQSSKVFLKTFQELIKIKINALKHKYK